MSIELDEIATAFSEPKQIHVKMQPNSKVSSRVNAT